MAVAEGREAVASDLLNVLHSIPIQSIATNGPSLVRSTSRCTRERSLTYIPYRCTRCGSSHRRFSMRFVRPRLHLLQLPERTHTSVRAPSFGLPLTPNAH